MFEKSKVDAKIISNLKQQDLILTAIRKSILFGLGYRHILSSVTLNCLKKYINYEQASNYPQSNDSRKVYSARIRHSA